MNTGAGMLDVGPAEVGDRAFWLTSATLMPTTMASVSVLLTSGLPNSDFFAYSSSKWIGCWFMVSSVNQVLSAAVMVRPGQCL